MLSLHGPEGPVALQPGRPVARDTVWLDLNDPTPEEAAAVEAATGLRVPSRAALSEVETSSRLRRVKGGLSLSTPMITFEQSASQLKPLGFLLTKDHLVTIRFHELRAFETSAKRIADGDGSTTPSEIFLVVLEELVDSLADALEDMGSELDTLSTRIFDFDVRGAERRRLERPRPGAAISPCAGFCAASATAGRFWERSGRVCSASNGSSRSSPRPATASACRRIPASRRSSGTSSPSTSSRRGSPRTSSSCSTPPSASSRSSRTTSSGSSPWSRWSASRRR